MPSQHTDTPRRTFLKAAGVGSLGMATSLAGCTGQQGGGGDGGGGDGGGGDGGGGDGGGGDGGGGDGGGGDGGGGGSTSEQELTEFNIVYPPWPGYPAFNYIHNQTDILEKELNDRGYGVGNVQISWDDTTLFMAGKVDFMPTAGAAESARMAMARDIELTVHAQAATNYAAWYVREGSDLDPANTGGYKQTFQKLIDEERPLGFAGWNQGSVWPSSAFFYDEFDMKYGPDTNPPLNLRQADWFTLPKLLVDDERVDMVINAPPLGMNAVLARDDPGVVPVRWHQNALEHAGLSPRTLNLGGFTTRTEFSENNEEAMIGWMDAWQQGVEFVANPDNWEDILSNEDNYQYLVSENRAEAEINLKFSYAENPSEVPAARTGNPLPVILQDVTLTDQRIQDYRTAIEMMETTGALQGDEWEDLLSFKALSV